MVQRVLEDLAGEPIEVFVVWIPAIGGDRFEATEKAMELIPDERARHYWDGSQALGEALSPVLGLRTLMAWDVYLVFDGDAEWGATAPAPLDWVHQLRSEDPERRLDEKRLVDGLRSALKLSQ